MAANCGWEPVDGFDSLAEYERIRDLISEQIRQGLADERRVAKPYSGLKTIDERWFRCKATGETWRLIAPDPPFPGIFDKV
jgi:hypothetical protein